jgi:hypothetical protein
MMGFIVLAIRSYVDYARPTISLTVFGIFFFDQKDRVKQQPLGLVFGKVVR